MKESNREGVANHPGPEPCEGGRKAALEALSRGIRRQDIELRNQRVAQSLCSSNSAALILMNAHSLVPCGLDAVRRMLFR
jgi:hypothetical protein